jgi:DNA-binding CsgD family transcriptional regulator
MFERSSPDRLLEASELAYQAGALALAATVDLQLLGLYGFLFEIDQALEVGARVVDVARTLGLSEVHAAALLQLGFVHAIAGRNDAVEAAVDAALRVSGEHPEALALAWGHARATYSLLTEDRSRAIEQLDIAMSWARQVPGISGIFPALWALVRVVEGAGAEVIGDVGGLETPAIPMTAAIVAMAEAVVAGRAGQRDRAEARFAAADGILRSKRVHAFRHLALRLVAEAAIEDGWGDPAGWLSEAMAFFEDSGHDRVAAACRDVLRQAGLRVARHVSADLPRPLRAAGVTAREAEVLRLVGERLSNREIAERLYLSPRTVEKHVERLLQKTGTSTRVELGRLARETFVTLPAGGT